MMSPLGRPIDRAVYLIGGGRVTPAPLPEFVACHTRFVGGPALPHAAETLEAVRVVASRCAPWLRVYVGQKLWTRVRPGEDVSAFGEVRSLRGGGAAHALRGQAFLPAGVVLVGAGVGQSYVLSTLHHEIWHAVEADLAAPDLAAVNKLCARGLAFPGDYLDSLVERRARAYQYWASARGEGWRPVCLFGVPLARADRVFSYVYSGGLAADRAGGRPVRERSFPGFRAARDIYRATFAWPLPALWVTVGLLAFLLG